MDLGRTNLNDFNQNRIYIILTVILVILSILGIILFFQIKKTSTAPAVSPTAVPTQTLSPTPTPIITTIASPSATPKIIVTPKLSVTLMPITPTPASITDNLPSISPTPLINLEKIEDGFSVAYSSSRKLYQDTKSYGNRYTFYLTKGNFAIHVGTKDWSWIHPDRQFSSNFLISSKPTFRYDTTTQTVVDVENNNIKYTIQCIHNDNSSLKAECEGFINSFKLL